MSMQLRQAKADDASAISELVQAGFVEHVASDWEPSAQRSFLEETGAEKLASRVSEAAVCLVYEQGGRVLGVILLPRPTLVQLLFVAPSHLRKGIGRALWNAARAHLEEKHSEVTTVELNSSPYALAAFRSARASSALISEPFRRKVPGWPARRLAGYPLEARPLSGATVWPNPSIERTFQRPLRALWPTAHVER